MSTVLVVGAGVIGCATALHLKIADPGLGVVVVEPDYTYARAATGKGTGGVRQLFTRPENIQMSQYTLDVIENWQAWASIVGASPASARLAPSSGPSRSPPDAHSGWTRSSTPPASTPRTWLPWSG